MSPQGETPVNTVAGYMWNVTATIATVWAAAFALLHLAWAAGSRFALEDPAAADAAFDQAWFRTYNLVVAVACLVVAVAVIRLTHPDRGAARERSRRLVWLAAGVLILRGGIGVVQFLTVALAPGDGRALSAWAIDLYMIAGGALLALVAWHARRRAALRDEELPGLQDDARWGMGV